MKYQFAAVAALAGSSYAALEGYGESPAGYGSESSSSAPAAPGYGSETTSSVAIPVYGASTTSAPAAPTTTYACNPAHQYPEGQVCTEVSGSLTLVTTTGTSSAPASDVTVTDVVSEYTTYCPEATTLTHGGSTYTISSATTLTITSCPGGCNKETATATATPSGSAPGYGSPSSSGPVGAETPSSSAPVVPGYGAPSSAVPSGTAPVVPGYGSPSSSGPVGAVTPSIPVYGTGFSTATTPAAATTPVAPYPYGSGNGTVPAASGSSSPSASATYPATYTGAASKVAGGAFLGLAGLIGALFM